MNTDKATDKPKAKVIGQDGNVFSTLSICMRALKKNNQSEKNEEMSERVFKSSSYREALSIMQEYCTFC